jgi:trichothecene 3-O-acetyltransferase
MDFNVTVDILGQQPVLNLYTQICSCYPVADSSSHSAIISTLTNGLEVLTASFPWLAGQIVNEGSKNGDTGVFKIKPLEKLPRLIVKDLTNDPSIPTMDTMRRANFPISMLDETIIAPRNTIPGTSGEPKSDTIPVFLIQANFIIGGLLLTFVSHHQAMDMVGQGHIMHLLSKACRNEQFTGEELSSGTLDRSNLYPLLDDSYKPGSELAYQIVNPARSPSDSEDNNDTAPPESPPCTWANFTFNAASLTALKSLTTKSISSSVGYVSTDDAMSALIFQSVTRARLPRLKHKTEISFARAVDVRRYLNIPAIYPGLLQNMSYHTFPLQELIKDPLGILASEFRSAVDPKTSKLGYNTRALATFFDRNPDRGAISFTATLDLAADIMLSSWVKIDCYDLDFNLGLGKPESVRRPLFIPVESLIYLLPKTLDGEISVALCLRDEDMERLKADDEFTKYAVYVG